SRSEDVRSSRRFLLFVRENLSLAVGEDQREFVGKPFPVMQDLGAVFLLLFPMIGELHRPPVGDVTIFSSAEHAVEHSSGTQQPDMATMQRRERPASNVPLFGEKHAAGLPVSR